MNNDTIKIAESDKGQGYMEVGGKTLVKKFSQSPSKDLPGCSEFLKNEFKKWVKKPTREALLKIFEQAAQKHNLKDSSDFSRFFEIFEETISREPSRAKFKEVYRDTASEFSDKLVNKLIEPENP